MRKIPYFLIYSLFRRDNKIKGDRNLSPFDVTSPELFPSDHLAGFQFFFGKMLNIFRAGSYNTLLQHIPPGIQLFY